MLFSEEIIAWYHRHKRDLPWRHTSDPYVIWLSEIILQQTRVEQGLPYFQRFIEMFPNVRLLAEADEGTVLRLWEGLGYYSRARNMHQTAKMVMENFEGVFPSRFDQLITLKGIGEYTAAAISSFSANEAKAVVDGNVFRVLARYFGDGTPINSTKGKKIFGQLANELLDSKNPAIHNQALMEFGALQCRPKNPCCEICPLFLGCVARKENKVPLLPVKRKGGKSKNRFFYYFIIREGDKLALRKRGPKDIWENMYEFPMIEHTEALSLDQLKKLPIFVDWFGEKATLTVLSKPPKHLLSHQQIFATFIQVEDIAPNDNKKDLWNYVFTKDLDTLAKPKLIFTFIRDYIICTTNTL